MLVASGCFADGSCAAGAPCDCAGARPRRDVAGHRGLLLAGRGGLRRPDRGGREPTGVGRQLVAVRQGEVAVGRLRRGRVRGRGGRERGGHDAGGQRDAGRGRGPLGQAAALAAVRPVLVVFVRGGVHGSVHGAVHGAARHGVIAGEAGGEPGRGGRTGLGHHLAAEPVQPLLVDGISRRRPWGGLHEEVPLCSDTASPPGPAGSGCGRAARRRQQPARPGNGAAVWARTPARPGLLPRRMRIPVPCPQHRKSVSNQPDTGCYGDCPGQHNEPSAEHSGFPPSVHCGGWSRTATPNRAHSGGTAGARNVVSADRIGGSHHEERR